jgi:hypothetical protein
MLLGGGVGAQTFYIGFAKGIKLQTRRRCEKWPTVAPGCAPRPVFHDCGFDGCFERGLLRVRMVGGMDRAGRTGKRLGSLKL